MQTTEPLIDTSLLENVGQRDPAGCDLAHWIKDLIEDSQLFDGVEQRAEARQPLVCAVELQCKLRQWKATAFSRNISQNGIGLITAEPVPLRIFAEVSIERFDGTAMKVAATSKWCKPYGHNWYASGWAFRDLIGVRKF